MKYLEYTKKLLNLQNEHLQFFSFILIYITFVWKFIYARDFVSGRLEYAWTFSTLTSLDVKLFSIMFILGMFVWYGTSELKRKYIKWRNS